MSVSADEPGGVKSNGQVPLVGEKCIEECVQDSEGKTDTDSDTIRYQLPTKAELHRTRDHIGTTQRVSPSRLGDPAIGMLKADQWRLCIEFGLPVSFVRPWLANEADTPQRALHRQKLVHGATLLAVAIRRGASRETSIAHAEQYVTDIHACLTSLLELSHNVVLHPNHCAALT